MIIDKWEELEEMLKPILSSAMHDIYNEINNIFFLYESTLLTCECIAEEKKKEIRNDFFTIIDQTKTKQFIFNNLCSNKLIFCGEFAKHIKSLKNFQYTNDIEISVSLLSTIFLLSNNNTTINITNNTIKFTPKLKFINNMEKYLKGEFNFLKDKNNLTMEWIEELYFFKINKYQYKFIINNNQVIINI